MRRRCGGLTWCFCCCVRAVQSKITHPVRVCVELERSYDGSASEPFASYVPHYRHRHRPLFDVSAARAVRLLNTVYCAACSPETDDDDSMYNNIVHDQAFIVCVRVLVNQPHCDLHTTSTAIASHCARESYLRVCEVYLMHCLCCASFAFD